MRSIELPGIGSKYEMETSEGDKIGVIFLRSGKIQLYILEKDKREASMVELNNYEARRLGSLLVGSLFTAEEEVVEVAFSALSDLRISIHTYVIPERLSGKSIRELGIREKCGATVIAVSRRGRNIVNPPPEFRFEKGDLIVLIGESHQIELFEKEILGK
ncbi:MAG: TrkA domain protein [Archaeoglobi archaeon]|nr:cation:proton antiporter regulatory subunit [Candidatus Mnemosynella sp.]MDI3502224.1 TrkA domain protein [Archaeoglobi archaeon]MDK2781456.1 TrkA domain protein [Archaeoglobi archaeon]